MIRKERQYAKEDANAFRQQVRMAAVQVTGLRQDELAMALAYEVEPFSGVPAGDAEVAYVGITPCSPVLR